ncbi:ankyrin [Lentithecium fluviatile CBS 122367]|uniref:Ankyrin n=1 Tax=Lentithecium fluviatile CBS 122367 TaxID=1168545 RepID=A0A6G1J454_9PLEO|nr:ankyrin [Lentithecium fluviatile CBS 122367]
MDPLSITASTITLITAANKASTRIYNLAKAVSSKSEEIRSILNELQDLQIVLSSAEIMIRGNRDEPWHLDPVSAFPVLLRRLQDKLVSIESFLRDFTDSSGDKGIQLKTLEWAVRGRDKARHLKDDIHSFKWNLSTSISTIAASSALGVDQSLTKVELGLQDLQQGVEAAKNLSIENNRRTLEATNDLGCSGESLMKYLEERLDQIKNDVDENSTTMFLRGQLNSLLPPSAVAMHLSLQQRIMCVPDCSCICHQWQYINSPQLLDALIGSVVIGYSGVRLATRKCTMSKCRVQATSALRFSYKFPMWMFPVTINFASYSRYGQPTAGLSVARIRPHTSAIFAFAEAGNVEGMKMLFDRGLASPFDVSFQTGDQPLHITADHGFLQASRLLVAYGADPHQQDTGRRNTPHSNAWNTILSGTVKPKFQNQLGALFVNVHASFEFSRLHEVVLGLRPGSLEKELDKPNCDINARDSFGNTALLWACRRGDEDSARILLVKGADPEIPNSNYGRTPLMAACVHPSVPIIKMLLENGVDVNVRTRSGLDALIYLVEEDRDPQPVGKIVEATRLLIERGISLQPHHPNNAWCVARAARNGLVEAMEVMLDHGAGVDSFCLGHFRITALARAIDWAVPASVEVLLRRGASYTGDVAVDLHGQTILHHVARNPNLDVIKVLIDAKLIGLDPNAVDNDGLTAEGCFNALQETIEGVRPAFMHLLADLKLGMSRPYEAALYQANEEDIFYDAVEKH